MDPLILTFAEEPTASNLETPEFHYSEILNLNILKNGECAVDHNSLGTESGTRTAKETSDTDKNVSVQINLLATESFTKASGEGSDTDRVSNDN
jgi:hypothetical protein